MEEGWIWPVGSSRHHYFRFEKGERSAKSICKKVSMSSHRVLEVDERVDSEEKCSFCVKKLEKEGD